MGLKIRYTAGQTPLDEDEKEGLLIETITTKAELDEFEQLNIENAVQWTMQQPFRREIFFTETFIKDLHQKMFSDTWAWAGVFRKTNKNIGVDKLEIGIELRKLLDDTLFWTHNQVFVPDEIAIRFKHRIVSIHCFANGNGRHSRLLADVIAAHIFRRPVFSWGAATTSQQDVRIHYLQALKAADLGNIYPLLLFARS
ncbi:mobile mystery protein B [Niabella drilacis]|uniref:Mobile mystery protein B n=1 Tax=Niabella drilacis (strain DSM 25811 / CCM 8410 / CCUG 62505 / LMG 26954 / E90) TaxID=1285928 RepID=A0A1G6N988_NIADE|nr:mobile mystery protein B [Niabella drilacis]SDC64261.1 mobile mystery protein B [Niabella drilacis]